MNGKRPKRGAIKYYFVVGTKTTVAKAMVVTTEITIVSDRLTVVRVDDVTCVIDRANRRCSCKAWRAYRKCWHVLYVLSSGGNA